MLCVRVIHVNDAFASNVLGVLMLSLVRPSNVSPVLVDYPRYLHRRRGETPFLSLDSCLHGVQLPTNRDLGRTLEKLVTSKEHSGKTI